METIADGVVTRAEIAQDGRGGGKIADEVKRFPVDQLVQHEGTLHLGGQHLVEMLYVLFKQAATTHDTCGVNNAVDGAEARLGGGQSLTHSDWIGDVSA